MWAGTRTSLLIGIIVAAINAFVGIVIGLLWGYVLVRLLRERLESLLPRHLGGLTELSGRVRDKAKRVLSSISDRRRFFVIFTGQGIIDQFFQFLVSINRVV